MTASKRFMNWTGVGFTPTGGELIPITGVTSVKFDDGSSMASFAGDGDRYNSMTVNDFNEPKCTCETGDPGCLILLPSGTTGVFTATLNDAKNKAATGAITYTFQAIVSGNSVMGKHRAYGMGTLEMQGNAVNGQTNPLATSVAT